MIFIVDGTFILKNDLKKLFDFKIYLNTSFNTAQKRGVKREAENFGSVALANTMFETRYHAACKLYLEEHHPMKCADVVVSINAQDCLNQHF